MRALRLVQVGGFMLAAAGWAQPASSLDPQRITPYWQYAELLDAAPSQAGQMQDRLNAAIRKAQAEFGGQGPALAQYFLNHEQARPSNSAFFFLFRAVGDVETALTLIPALTNPPVPQGMVLGRDPAEVEIAIKEVLGNDAVRTSPRVAEALSGAIQQARARLGYGRAATSAISVLGKCRTPEATRELQTLARDGDPAIRGAALSALGDSGQSAAAPALAQAVAGDQDPEVRARSAETLAGSSSADSAAVLRASLEKETDPRVIDETVRALTALRALPTEPGACLEMAARCWDTSAAAPVFRCWRAAASRDALLRQALSASWTVRALALDALTQRTAAAGALPIVPLVPAAPRFDPTTRDRLLESAVELLSQNLSGAPAPNTVSYSTAQLARNAVWEISGRSMAVALRFADRIVPLSGHYASAGRYGESYDLAAKDPRAYAAARRSQQLLAAGLVTVLFSALLAVPRLRRIAVGLLAGAGAWGLWSLTQTGIEELPPPPLGYLTASCLAFLCGGLAAGWLTGTRLPTWLKVAGAAALSGVSAFVVCGWTRSAGWFPIGSEGWQLIFDPLGSALLAVPFGLILSLILVRWRPGAPGRTA